MFLGPLFLILLIIGIIFLFMSPTQNNRGNCHTSNYINNNKPMDILKERYAKGEISEEEYIRAKRNLE